MTFRNVDGNTGVLNKIRTTKEVIEHLPRLYREVAEYLVEHGEIEIVSESPVNRGG
jgi:hypothetical protein